MLAWGRLGQRSQIPGVGGRHFLLRGEKAEGAVIPIKHDVTGIVRL